MKALSHGTSRQPDEFLRGSHPIVLRGRRVLERPGGPIFAPRMYGYEGCQTAHEYGLGLGRPVRWSFRVRAGPKTFKGEFLVVDALTWTLI